MSEPVIDRVTFSGIIEKCKHCSHDQGYVTQAGQHYKLTCHSCGKYIKMLSKREYEHLLKIKGDDDIINIAFPPEDHNDYSLEHLHFKIDLILDHLNIRIGK